DINPTTGFLASSDPQFLTNVNGTLLFGASDGLAKRQLWRSDGTAGGTMLVKEFGSAPAFLTNVNGTLYFKAGDATTANELWKSDGTPGGTVFIKNIRPGTRYT